MRTPGKVGGPRTRPPAIAARLSRHITLEPRADGALAACFQGQSVGLGTFSASAAERAGELRTGLPLGSIRPERSPVDKEVDLLVRRLARSGLLEYRLGRTDRRNDLVVIEPQTPDYWPRTPGFEDADSIVLSRFAYLRRRGDEMVLESPRAAALFRIGDPKIAGFLAALSLPHPIKKLRRQDGFPGSELLALLLDCQILFKVGAAGSENLRAAEGDDHLVVWDFHDLLFHTRSTEGRQANPIGGLYAHVGRIAPQPAVRPAWPGEKIQLRPVPGAATQSLSPVARMLHDRHSTRSFDDRKPVTVAELSLLLDQVARVRSKWQSQIDLAEEGPVVAYTSRPYPSAGSAYELELYLAVANCDGLARGFYHYDADGHALVPIAVRPHELDAMLAAAEFAMDAPTPQVLITIAARFGRVSWKYSSIAYSLILKNVGVLIQTLYVMAADIGLGGCAIGTTNIDLFAKMTGVDFHAEGPVGQFALGRGAEPDASG